MHHAGSLALDVHILYLVYYPSLIPRPETLEFTMVPKNHVAHCLITVLRKQLALEHCYIYWCIVHVLVMVKGCFLCKNDLILLIYMYKYSLLLIHVWYMYVDAYETNLMLCWSWFWYFYLTVYNSVTLWVAFDCFISRMPTWLHSKVPTTDS